MIHNINHLKPNISETSPSTVSNMDVAADELQIPKHKYFRHLQPSNTDDLQYVQACPRGEWHRGTKGKKKELSV